MIVIWVTNLQVEASYQKDLDQMLRFYFHAPQAHSDGQRWCPQYRPKEWEPQHLQWWSRLGTQDADTQWALWLLVNEVSMNQVMNLFWNSTPHHLHPKTKSTVDFSLRSKWVVWAPTLVTKRLDPTSKVSKSDPTTFFHSKKNDCSKIYFYRIDSPFNSTFHMTCAMILVLGSESDTTKQRPKFGHRPAIIWGDPHPHLL